MVQELPLVLMRPQNSARVSSEERWVPDRVGVGQERPTSTWTLHQAGGVVHAVEASQTHPSVGTLRSRHSLGSPNTEIAVRFSISKPSRNNHFPHKAPQGKRWTVASLFPFLMIAMTRRSVGWV